MLKVTQLEGANEPTSVCFRVSAWHYVDLRAWRRGMAFSGLLEVQSV